MGKFKRDNVLAENVKEIASEITNDNGQRDAILQLVQKYENTTYPEWRDKDAFTVATIKSMVNDYGFADDEVADAMSKEHRTIQQSFMRLCMKFIKKMSEHESWDGRNEASVKIAKQIMEALSDNIYLPCV